MNLVDGPKFVEILNVLDVTDLVWIPDSALGAWDHAVSATASIRVVRPAREGEAIAIGAGLWIGGRRPLVAMQCTGFYEAGDAIRNFIHDLRIPLWMIVGIRSYFAAQTGVKDSAMEFIEPVLTAWKVPYSLINATEQVDAIPSLFREAMQRKECHIVLLAE